MTAAKFIFVAGFLAALPLCPAQVVSSGQTIRHHREAVVENSYATAEVSRAEDEIQKKNYEAAEKDLLDATQKDPKNYEAWYDLGYVYSATGKQPDAIAAYRKSVEANPQVFESTFNLGIALARGGDPDAEKYLRAATNLKPVSNPNEGLYHAWLTLGQLVDKSKPQEAAEAYQNAAKLHPKDAEPHLLAAMALERQNQLEQAAGEYQKAAELDPKSSDALAGVVNCDTKLEKLPEAEAALRKFIALDANNAAAHTQLGRVLAAEHKWDDATAELEQGVKLHSEPDVDAEKQLASIYIEQREYGKAVPHIENALKAAPNDPELHHWLGVSLLDSKNFSAAQGELLTAIKLKPDYGQAYGDLAFAASENKDYALTIKALDARAKLLQEIPATYFLRATAYDHLKQNKLAADNYRQFLAVADGRFPEQEWQAKHRLIAIDPKK